MPRIWRYRVVSFFSLLSFSLFSFLCLSLYLSPSLFLSRYKLLVSIVSVCMYVHYMHSIAHASGIASFKALRGVSLVDNSCQSSSMREPTRKVVGDMRVEDMSSLPATDRPDRSFVGLTLFSHSIVGEHVVVLSRHPVIDIVACKNGRQSYA